MRKGMTKSKDEKGQSRRNPIQRERIQARLERKLDDLSKHYKDNKYEIRDGNVVRVSGRRPHKVSKKAVK